jgi:hypothetical protein
MDSREIGCNDMDWINLTLSRVQWWALLNTVMKGRP